MKILITGGFQFPDKDACAVRALGFGKALRESGHEIFFAGFEEKERPEDINERGEYEHQGFPYKSMDCIRSKDRSVVGRLRHYWTSGNQVLEWLRLPSTPKFDTVITCGGSAQFLEKLCRYCRKTKKRLVCDWGEWMNASQLEGGYLSPLFWSREIAIRFITPKFGNVIVTSEYFRKYFQNKHCHVIRIPHLLDFDEQRWFLNVKGQKIDHGKLKLVYIGFPGRKDLLLPAFRGGIQAVKAGFPVEFHLFGPSLQDIVGSTEEKKAIADELGDRLFFHGRIPQQDVPKTLAEYDASFLLRPNLRYANAGFATKIEESLASGVPVFANDTSDIWEYLTDGLDGIRVASEKPEDFCAAIKKWFGLSEEKRHEMRTHARKCAETSFGYQNYVKIMDDFVRDCK